MPDQAWWAAWAQPAAHCHPLLAVLATVVLPLAALATESTEASGEGGSWVMATAEHVGARGEAAR
eukprot:4337540-Pyramimonas_sp.AAC.1